MKRFALFVICVFSLNCAAQFSKTHYLPPLSAAANIPAEDQFLYISTPSIIPVNFKIINLGGGEILGTVSRDVPYVYTIGFDSNTQLIVPSSQVNTVRSDKGFIIEAEDLIYVSARILADQTRHAGSVVSKGRAALGKVFRIGSYLNLDAPGYGTAHYSFISILATENNTAVQISGIKPGTQILGNELAGNAPIDIVLNSGQSYVVAVRGPHTANRDALIGSLVSSDKPIAVNCGSFGGTNGELSNMDLGFDQIVPAERTGKEYIFIKSTGMASVERVLLVAHQDTTRVFINGSNLPAFTINAGEYATFNGNDFSGDGNLYVSTSKDVFAYQGVGSGTQNQANQEFFFVPPLSCETPRIIDNIPFIERVGDLVFSGRITIVTEAGSAISFLIDGTPMSINNLPPGTTVSGPNPVTGNPNFETYTIEGLRGNVSVFSTTQLYVASYGSYVNATFGGYYSGFTFAPAISFEQIDITQPNCLPNIQLSVNEVTGFDTFEWYFNGVLASTDPTYVPTQPGSYYVSATISVCQSTLRSDEIPVSACTADLDNDTINDNIDVDNDNDGITNCDESFGDVPINLTNPLAGGLSVSTYENSFTGIFPTPTGAPAAVPFQGSANGDFVSSVSPGLGNSMIYRATFAEPLSLVLKYVENAAQADYLNSNGDFTISTPPSSTITVLNPTNQLLIDTNYDGIYESGITEFSSFEIRFRVRNTLPLTPGGGTFELRTAKTTSISISHRNLSADSGNNATFNLTASCVSRDTDGDGFPDQIDYDSDNDGIPDLYEAQSGTVVTLTGSDTNQDGLDDLFNNAVNADSDFDGIPNYIDLDSDNDGIFDVVESGVAGASANGILTGTIGSNGLVASIENNSGSGINYAIADSDADGLMDAVENDSDDDGCSDVREAGFSDPDNDAYLGTAPIIVNGSGVVTGALGYTAPNANYIQPVPILIAAAINDVTACEMGSATFSIQTNDGVAYQWQVSVNDISYTNIIDNAMYSGSNTASLTITNIALTMQGYKYRVILNKAGNVCGLESPDATLLINARPIPATHYLTQCDTGAPADGITQFNLSQADALFTAENSDYSVAYYANSADEANGATMVNEYTNLSNPQSIIAKVTDNTSGCFTLSTLILVANVLPTPVVNLTPQCDYDGIEDGFFELNLTVPFGNSPSVTYYETENDALLEQNQIANPANYTNLEAYADQTIFVRAENGNDCVSITTLIVEVNPLPPIDANESLVPFVVCVNDTVFTTQIDAGILDGSSPTDYSYQWYSDGAMLSGETGYSLTITSDGTYSVEVTNADGCSKIRTIPVIASSSAIIDNISVDDLSDANTVIITLTDNSYGDYVYSLDYPNAFQVSNVFSNISPGFHTVFVKDINGCPITTQVVAVIGIPKFFTPNGDGYNDTWHVKGIGQYSRAGTITQIFDRYGKLIQELSASDIGWDGTFNGQMLPSDDYWYVVKFDDANVIKGNFSLKR